jgi:predicted ATPase/DNA-binding winged helix-turn-helix (wHTH) protein
VSVEPLHRTEDELRFGPFRLSRHRRELATDSGPVVLGARALDLLLVLINRPGQLFSKHELLDLVWSGLAVEENNLHVQMVALRRALGAHQNCIQTVPGRGYRFIGDLTQPRAAPSPAPETPSRTNLPMEFSRLIGREAELAALQACLRQSRLVTITGPGGIGKTRLAIALGHAVREDFPAAWLIDLAPLADPSLIAGAAASALGLRLSADTPPVETLAAGIGAQRALLIFDNCEHLLAGVALLVGALLRRVESASIIATSQEPLRIEAEMTYRLDPLAVPPAEATALPELLQYGAVALFLRQVEAADRRFQAGPENSAAIAEICRRLEGIPLALEMAAARVPALGIERLRQRLGERLRMLTTGARTAAARHRTLRDTVAWSYELLDAPDRAVFRRLGVFAGGFSADSAVAVLATDADDEWALLDALGRLIDKSLAVAEPGEVPRYRLLETLRLFAAEQLAEQGEQAEFQRRHARHFNEVFARSYESWESTEDSAWLAQILPELDNLRAALDWALDAPDRAELAISLAGAAALFWDKMSLLAEGRRYLERAEVLLSDATPPEIAARLHRQIGNLWLASDRPRALAALLRAEKIYRALGDQANLGAVLALLGPAHSFLGASAEATRVLREARALLEPAGKPKSLLNVMNNLGVLAVIDGDMVAAREIFEQALRITRRAGARDGEVMVLINLAEIEFNLGQFDAAVARASTAVAYLREGGRRSELGWTLVNLATYLLISGQAAQALPAAREALALVRPIGGFILRACLQQWALLAACAGRLMDAAELGGFADAGFEQAGEPRQPTEQRVYDELRALLEAGLTPAALAQHEADGRAWSEAEAATFATRLAGEMQEK